MSHNKFKRGFSCKMWIENGDLQEFKEVSQNIEPCLTDNTTKYR
jgi:hypothetical protein